MSLPSFHCTHNHALEDSPDMPPVSVCLIKCCISRIQDAQAGLAHRGGVFSSKQRGNDNSFAPDCVSHKDWTNKWRLAKIDCYKAVRKMEELTVDSPEDARKWGVEEALRIWEEAEEECCRVPGYKYISDEGQQTDPGNDGDDIVLSPTVDSDLKTQPVAITDQAVAGDAAQSDHGLTHEDQAGNWEIVKHKRRRSQSSVSPPVLKPPEKASSDEVVLWEMEGLTERLNREPTLADNNHFDVLAAETADTTSSVNSELKHITTSDGASSGNKPLSTGGPQSDQTYFKDAPTTPPSALKGGRFSTTQPSTPRVKYGIVINPLATLVSDHNTPGSEPNTPIVRPHNEHTMAENNRSHLVYSRASPSYQAGTWASPEGFQKTDTSGCNYDWRVYEALQRTLDRSETRKELPKSEEQEAMVTQDSSVSEKFSDWAIRVKNGIAWNSHGKREAGTQNVTERDGSHKDASSTEDQEEKREWKEEESER